MIFNCSYAFSIYERHEVEDNLFALHNVLKKATFVKTSLWEVLGFKNKPNDITFMIELDRHLEIAHPETWKKIFKKFPTFNTVSIGKAVIDAYNILRRVKEEFVLKRTDPIIDSFSNWNLHFNLDDSVTISMKNDLAGYFVHYDSKNNQLSAYAKASGEFQKIAFEQTLKYQEFDGVLKDYSFDGKKSTNNSYIEEIKNIGSNMRGKKIIDMTDERFSQINNQIKQAVNFLGKLWPEAREKVYYYSLNDLFETIPGRPKLFEEIPATEVYTGNCARFFQKSY